MLALRATLSTLLGLIFDDAWVAGGVTSALIVTALLAGTGSRSAAGLVLMLGIIASLGYSLWQVPRSRKKAS
jgi:hypothetical protein